MRSSGIRRWFSLTVMLVLVAAPLALTGCGDDDNDGPAVTSAPATPQDLAGRTFVFTGLIDPGVTSTVTIGQFSGTPQTAAISVDSDDGSLVGGTIALGSCDITPTIAVIDGGEPITDPAALAALEIEPALFDPCEVGSDGTLRLTDEFGDTFTSRPGAAAQALVTFTVPLSTQFQVDGDPAVYARDDAGTATLTLYEGNLLSYTIDVPNLAPSDGIFMAHIHVGDLMSNGPIDITLANQPAQPDEGRPAEGLPGFGPTDTRLTASVILMPDESASLQAVPQDFYVNVHSNDFPPGLVRGQVGETIVRAFNTEISVAAEAAAPVNAQHAAQLVGRVETGFAQFRLLDDNTLGFKLRVDDLLEGDALTASHIHEGGSTAAGPVFITLVADFAGAVTAVDFLALEPAAAARLRDPAESLYVNVHSQQVPAGLVRGQLRDPVPSQVALELLADGLTSPVGLESPDDGSGRMFIVDQVGTIRVIAADGSLLTQPFLDLSSEIVALDPGFDERGLLGMAFHPQYATNGRFFARYSKPRVGEPAEACVATSRGCHEAVLAEFTVSADPNLANPTGTILLRVDQPQFNHNGGQIAFGPDGFMYLSLGDGGAANDVAEGHTPGLGNGQDPSQLLGKILRIDVDGSAPFAIPPDNPFVNTPGFRPEIFAFGLRNPFRFSFDTGGDQRLFVGDVGQNLFEEIDIVVAGGNYGWNIREGANCFDPDNPGTPPASCPDVGAGGEPLLGPIIEYPHVDGSGDPVGVSVTGGYVYRGSAFPGLQGAYFFGDFSRGFAQGDGSLFLALEAADGTWERRELMVAGTPDGRLGRFVLAFGQDTEGEVYVLTTANLAPTGTTGQVHRIVPAP